MSFWALGCGSGLGIVGGCVGEVTTEVLHPEAKTASTPPCPITGAALQVVQKAKEDEAIRKRPQY